MNNKEETAPTSPIEVADLLMRKYASLRSEVELQISFYKSHVRNFQLLAGALVAAGALVLSNHLTLLPTNDTWLIWFLGLFTLTLTANYLFLDILDPQYSLLLLSCRLATLEVELNNILGRRLFIWENGASANGYSGIFPYAKILNPHVLISFCGISIFVVIALIVPAYGYWVLYNSPISTSNSLIHPVVSVGFIVSVALTSASIYCVFSIFLGPRDEPRRFYERLLAVPLSEHDEP